MREKIIKKKKKGRIEERAIFYETEGSERQRKRKRGKER